MYMINYLLILTSIFIFHCQTSSEISVIRQNDDFQCKLDGFVFIDISKIYHHGGEVIIFGSKKDTIVHIKDKTIKINGIIYQTIEQDYLLKSQINVNSFDPENGLFGLESCGFKNNFHKIRINKRIGLINSEIFGAYAEFKDFKRYIMDTYPIPTKQNPLRTGPSEKDSIIYDFDKWTYLSVEIIGDWLRVIDDKDCYSGVAPSEKEIIGWIRWRKNGIFILKVAYTC